MAEQEAIRIVVRDACSTCGGELPVRVQGSGRQKRFCSPGCWPSSYKSHRPKPRSVRDFGSGSGSGSTWTCVVCGLEFHLPTRPTRRKCCSTACLLVRSRTAALGRKYPNRSKRFRECVVCRTQFTKRNTGSKGLCCGRRCGFAFMAWQGLLSRQVRERALALDAPRRKQEREEKARIRAEQAQRAQRQAYTEHVIAKRKSQTDEGFECGRCGKRFYPSWGDKRRKFCSSTCANRQSRSTARKQYGRKHTDRARKKGVPRCYSIRSTKVFERDGWRCQLCGKRIPKRLQGTNDDRAPSIDHIIPLSHPESPGHVWSNVQCAHRACNTAKSARARGQLRIF